MSQNTNNGDADDDNYEEPAEEKTASNQSSSKTKPDFLDDEAEEDPEEEEEEEEEDDEFNEMKQGRAAKRPRGMVAKKGEPVNKFIDDMADEDSGGDEDEIEEEVEPGFVEEKEAAEAEAAAAGATQALYREHQRRELEVVERLEKSLTEHPDESQYQRVFIEPGAASQKVLPSIRDPKMWAVKCKLGKERELVTELMRRFFERKNAKGPDRILIKSAIASDNIKGYFYVEADKEAHARQAVANLRMVFQNKLKLVPVKEMVDVLAVPVNQTSLQTHDWVRVKRGMYKGDLAQVLEVDEPRSRATIKLVPRLDAAAIKSGGGLQDEEGEVGKGLKRGKFKAIIPARLFNPDEFAGMEIQLKKDQSGQDYILFNNLRFQDGFLIKSAAFQSLEMQNVNPSLDEMRKFQKNDETVDKIALDRARSKQSRVFKKGDLVQVVEGELKNLMGIVESVEDNNMINMLPQHPDLHDLLTFPVDHLQKYFKTGTHVKVTVGTHEGETGMVARVDGPTAVILSDLSLKEISVLTQDLQECAEVSSSGKTELSSYQIFDLVQLNQQTVGMIFKIEGTAFKVLDHSGKVQTVPLQQMGQKRGNVRAETCLDSRQNAIKVGDHVDVIDGPFKGRQGAVRHIYRYFVFLYSRDYGENMGNYVVRANFLALCTGASASRSNVFAFPLHPRGGGRGGSGRGGGGRGAVVDSRGNRRNLAMIGKAVTIRSGQWKGYRGIVKEATTESARIELATTGKQVTVPASALPSEGDLDRPANTPASYNPEATPRHLPQTPMHGINTPMRGMDDFTATPSRTPHSFPTPSRDPWNPANPNTPSHQEMDYSLDSIGTGNTPAFSPAVYGAPSTPGDSTYYTSSARGFTPLPTTPGSAPQHTPVNPYSPYPNMTMPEYVTTPASGPTPSPAMHGHGYDERTPHTATPGTSFIVPTPGSAYVNPGTPGALLSDMMPEDIGNQQERCFVPGAEVVLKAGGAHARVAEVRSNTCMVQMLPEKGSALELPLEQIAPVVPQKRDRVVILGGQFKGSFGELIGIDASTDGIVRLEEKEKDIKILEMSQLCKAAA